MITQAMVDELVNRGQAKSVLSLANIQSIVPFESLTIEQIGDLTAQLEAEGIVVEINDELLRAPVQATSPPAATSSNPASLGFVAHLTQPAPAQSAAKMVQHSFFNIRPSGFFVRRSRGVFRALIIATLLLAMSVIWVFV
jgi:hypothetical protein